MNKSWQMFRVGKQVIVAQTIQSDNRQIHKCSMCILIDFTDSDVLELIIDKSLVLRGKLKPVSNALAKRISSILKAAYKTYPSGYAHGVNLSIVCRLHDQSLCRKVLYDAFKALSKR